MSNPNKSYRIRTEVGSNAPNVIHVPFNQTYDMFEILSLKLGQVNSYKSFDSDYGVLVGRVIANGGFGIPNAKVSVFISVDSNASFQEKLIYNFSSVFQKGNDDVRYNLLPEDVDNDCHQGIGSFPSKTKMLDDNTTIETFDKYWKYTTTTNSAGDYMLFGIPTGTQQVHVDIDLSDCGILSQRPHDMIGKGYNLNMFESPNQFKKSKDIDSLAQVITQNRSVYIYPYWGDITEGQDKFSLTRCDIEVDYKFESFAIFMGSIMTDKPGNAIGKNCTANANLGNMSDLTTGEGSIEMIRKTIDGKVEEFQIDGNRLIDGDGVWCYPIPMNLDYVKTDEFGTMVPTDNPNKGIATRARVRFRISLDDELGDTTAMKRAKFLVPNNPRIGDEAFDDMHEPDFEFGSLTKEESYRDLLWNNVYSVKSYIPKLQKTASGNKREHTGIKLVNHYGDNNPMPYNTLKIKLGLVYMFMCAITKIVVALVYFVNVLISIVGVVTGTIYKFAKGISDVLGKIPLGIGDIISSPFKLLANIFYALIPKCIALGSDFCDDGINPIIYYPGCGSGNDSGDPYNNSWSKTKKELEEEQRKKYPKPEEYKQNAKYPSNTTLQLNNCIENQLAQGNDAISFDFANDWINGTLYAPLWYRKITPKKSFLFGLIKIDGRDEWCSGDYLSNGLKVVKGCAIAHNDINEHYKNTLGQDITIHKVDGNQCGEECNNSTSYTTINFGIIKPKKTFIGQTVYYYVPVEWDKTLPKNKLTEKDSVGEVKLLFATDLILLGNLNECNSNGTPQFFRYLTSTTYNMSTDVLFSDWDFKVSVDKNGNVDKEAPQASPNVTSEAAGNDWGNPNEFGKFDGGLFYSIGCTKSKMVTKSCINLSRICEYGVSLDETKEVPDLNLYKNNKNATKRLITDGFISWDELYNSDQRSMFATMNVNNLKTIQNQINGLSEYDFSYLYVDNFDGSLEKIMKEQTQWYSESVNYKNNYKLEQLSKDYYLFRMGNKPYFYDSELIDLGLPNTINDEFRKLLTTFLTNRFPRYENSFYFYFGLKSGKTALDKFNSRYFAECKSGNTISDTIDLKLKPNSWCADLSGDGDGYIAIDCTSTSTPYNLKLTNTSLENKKQQIVFNEKLSETKIYLSQVDKEGKPKTEDENLRNKGYTQKILQKLYNGAYRGSIEDSEGSIFDFTFNLFPKLLSFKTNTQDFTVSHEELVKLYDIDGISSHKDNTFDKRFEDSNKNFATRDIGGVITIYDVYIPDDGASFKLTIVNKKKPKDFKFTKKITNGEVPDVGKELLAYFKDEKTGLYTFAVGVNKGGVEYEIQITQLCTIDEKVIDTKNSVTTSVFVKEPQPPKLYVNDIDYDLLTKFDNNTGWNINGVIDRASSSTSFTKIGVNMSNPWFHIDDIFNNDVFYEISEIHFKDEKFIGMKNGVKVELSKQDIKSEFTKKNVPNVPYTWVDEYVVDDALGDMGDFAESVNKAMSLRKQLVKSMYKAFYISNKQNGGSVTAIGFTDDGIYKTTVVYQQEEYDNDKQVNILTSGEMTVEENPSIGNISIPNITYDEANNYIPIVGNSNGYDKKPYSVGLVTSKGTTKPVDDNGKNLNSIGQDFDIQLDYSRVLTRNLFNFPLIDNIMKIKHSIWLPANNIPKFMAGADHTYVSMDGIVAARVTNGIAVNDKFDTQIIGNSEIVLSVDYMDKSKTYVSQRVICGHNEDETLKYIKKKLLKLITLNYLDDVCGYINKKFGLGDAVTADNVNSIISSMSLNDRDVVITYESGGKNINKSVSLSELEVGMLPFTNYKATENIKVTSNQQYCILTDNSNTLQLLDAGKNGEIVSFNRLGDVLVDAENDCSKTKQIIKVKTSKNMATNNLAFSVISINSDGNGYPLNKAKKDIESLVWQINDTVNPNNAYSIDNSQNLYSIATTYELLTNPFLGMLDVGFNGLKYKENGMPAASPGVCPTGIFEFDNSEHKPFFIVASTDSVRTISPVYHFADVEVVIKYGNKTSNGNAKKCVAISVKENPNNHYFNEYDFYIEGNVGNIVIAKERIKPKEYLYKELSDGEYNSIANDVVKASKNTKITLTDCVGVKHKCKITKDVFVQTTI